MPDGDVGADDDWRPHSELPLAQNRCPEALDLFTIALEHHPDDPTAWVGKTYTVQRHSGPGCHATFYADEPHDLASPMREILTALISGANRERSQ